MNTKRILLGLCALTVTAVVSVVALSHRHPPAPVAVCPAQSYEVRGQIRAIDTVNRIVRISHEAIPNYMPAMTMPFPVKDPGVLRGLTVGDAVQFQLLVTTNDSWVGRIEKIAPDSALAEEVAEQPPASASERETERVHTGELVPDFSLIDQDGHPFRLSDFRGQAVVLTFVYTRCPLPNFCPLMSRNFSELERRLSAEFPNRFHLVSVTMDPDFDRPAVLKEYGARYGANAKDWTFATGSAGQIQFVASLMGLYYERQGGLISHDLRTALIAPNGRLVQLWKSNVWTPYEVQRFVRETLTGAKDVAAR